MLRDPQHERKITNDSPPFVPSINCYVDVKPTTYETSFFFLSFMTFLLPDQRETCCYAWHGTRPSHLLAMRPSLGHKAPGSLSQGSNRQEFFSPGSVNRRVAPWGDVSSWVKGAE
jgi:hypothetical protein